MRTLLLALTLAMSGPAAAQTQPPSKWLNASIDGRTVPVYGWMEGGYVRYWPSQNPQLGADAQPMAGVVVDRDGRLNAGVETRALGPHANQLDTNDPEFAARFYEQREGRRRCDPDDEPLPFGNGPGEVSPIVFLAAGLVVVGAVIVLGSRRRQ